jgi:hypothetical protein
MGDCLLMEKGGRNGLPIVGEKLEALLSRAGR